MKNIKKKIKKKIYKIIRFLIIKEYTQYLGKIEEHDDKIICYVNNKKLNKRKKYSCYDIFFAHLLDKEIANNLKLNKPIYYVVENMKFDRMLNFYSVPNTYIKFKKCTFTDVIKIDHANVTFENNKYFNNYSVYAFNKCFLEGVAENLEFINENFIDLKENKKSSCFGIDIKAKNVKIINSQINANENNGEINLKVKENLVIKDSEVFSPVINIDAKNIKTEDSALIATEIINIKNENNNQIGSIQSNKIIYNGLNINEDEITKEKYELETARQRLINKLRELRNKCNNANNYVVNNVVKNLNEQSVLKTLKK